MISTSFMIGTGFIKCMPITFSARFVTAAILVIGIELVFEAKIVFSGQISSSCLKRSSLIFSFSVAASTTKSTDFAPSFKSV